MSEAELQRAVTDALEWGRWEWHHETDSRLSRPGFPDIVAASRGRLLAVECKTAKGRLTDEQSRWLEQLEAVSIAAGSHVARVGVLRPEHLDRVLGWISARAWMPLPETDRLPLR